MMELSVKELNTKLVKLRQENQEYANKVRAEIAQAGANIQQLQQSLRERANEAQRKVDLADGRIKGLEELIKEMGGVPEGTQGEFVPAPAPAKNDRKRKSDDAPAS